MTISNAQTSSSTQGRIRVSPRILDHLGISAYNSLRKCLAELAANSYDADATEVRISVPDVVDDSAVIDIVDNTTARRFYLRNGATHLNKHWLVWNNINIILGGR